MLLLGSLLLSALALPPVFAQSTDEITLPDLGTPAANTGSVQPNINAQGAGFNYRDNIDGKLISINPQYNQQNGVAVGGSLASPIAKNMAVGILLTAGSDKNEWLLNTGFDLTSNQRFIFSLGQLRQKLDFNFISGSQKTSVRQDNIAGSYQYFLGKDWLNAAEVNAYLSNTGSITLGDKTYFTDTTSLYELWSDPRRIAGGRVTGVQGRLVFTPTSKTTIKVGLGAERLTYDYLTGNESTTRATGSAELVQRLDNDFNFRASANAASSQNRYALGLGRSFKGGAQLGIDVATIQGRDNTFNDNQLLLSYTQSFGGNNASAFGSNTMGMNNTALNNLDASGAPMNQAYANTATPSPNANTWASSLVDQVSRRPSFLPSQVIAKIDTTATPTRLIAIDKTAVPVGSSINNATGVITAPTGTPVSGIAGVTKNTVAFTNAGQFALSGTTALVINPNLITQPAVGLTDTYIVTMNNSSGGGTTLATVVVSHGSVKIDSIVMSSGTLVINTAAIAGVTAPVGGATPVTSVSGTGYTGTVTWNGSPSTFAYNTAYTATVTLTATTGYTLTGVTQNFFTVAGTSPTATNSAGSGVVTAAFPATANAVISTAAIAGVTAPVAGATPVTTTTAGTGYTGTVTWSPAVSGTFAYNTAYTATVTLTAASGYTLTGVTANFFTVAGTSSAATNSAGSGVVTAAFPTTTAILPPGYVSTGTSSGSGSIGSGASWNLLGGGTLIWSKNNSTVASYSAALAACVAMNNSSALGYSDWRLPTQQELSGLYNSHTALTGWTSAFTWSSTAGGGGHYDVDLNVGGVGWIYDGTYGYVSCVH